MDALEGKDCFTVKKYLITSDRTKKPYINENRQAYMFTMKQEAEAFSAAMVDTVIKAVSEEDLTVTMSSCYAAGATTVSIQNSEGKNVRTLNERKLNNRFYNSELSANITRMLHTKKVSYLRNLAKCNFVVPIRITNNKNVSIVYATVTREITGDSLYLTFTDLVEYRKWAQKVKGWEPLLVDAAGLKRIGGQSGLMLDVYGGRVILTKEMLKNVNAEEMEDEEE